MKTIRIFRLAALLASIATGLAVTPTQADSREDVRRLQVELLDLGYDPGPADGAMGRKTREAMGRFLKAQQLPAEAGVAETLAAIDAFRPARAARIEAFLAIPREEGYELQKYYSLTDRAYFGAIVYFAPTTDETHVIYKNQLGAYIRASADGEESEVAYAPQYLPALEANPFEAIIHFVNLEAEAARGRSADDFNCGAEAAMLAYFEAAKSWVMFGWREARKKSVYGMRWRPNRPPQDVDESEQPYLFCVLAALENIDLAPAYQPPPQAQALIDQRSAAKREEAERRAAEAAERARAEQEAAAMRARAGAVDDFAALEGLLAAERQSPYAYIVVQRLEALHLKDVRANGPGCRPVVPEFEAAIGPPDPHSAVSVVVSQAPGLVSGDPRSGFAPVLQFSTELGHDRMLFSVGAMTGAGGGAEPLRTDGAVHRARGVIELGGAETRQIVQTGDLLDRPTFGLFQGLGYVYLRGAGRIVRATGDAIELGAEPGRPCAG